jgi:hypothetical protein
MVGSKDILRADAASAHDELAAYYPDLDRWPNSWIFEERDFSPGWQVVECFKSFCAIC